MAARQYTSAGAVVTTTDVDRPRALLLDQVRVTGQRQTVAPKGRLEPGESPLAAAFREVTEEAGLRDLAYAGYLGQDSYAFTDNDGQPAAKTVDWFLLTTGDPTTNVRAGEGFTAARWVDLDQAASVASHPGFAVYLDRAADLLAWRRSTPVAHSRLLNQVVRQAAAGASAILSDQPGAGLVVCGSGARGDRMATQQGDLTALRDFAAARLAEPAAGDAARRDRIRRTLSAAGSAARIVAADLDPRVPLRLPAVAALLRTRWADNSMSTVLEDYDAFRRDAARDLQRAAALAERVPDAIDALIASAALGTATGHVEPAR
ncbi:MAG: NUDIX domain-containing protein [Dactylosporangium sp.]|nr:NUDIX domain-containing protein [Dactylosporangium sp.]